MAAIAPTRADAYQLVHEGALALAEAERYGVQVDVEYCVKKKKHLERQSARLNKKILLEPEVKEWKKKYKSRFNLSSDEQLADILYNVLGYKPAKVTAKSQGSDNEKGSTDQESLASIDLHFVGMYLKGKKYKKAWDVINGIVREQVKGLIHPNYTLHFTDTYRSSCRDPNLQNVPIRDAFLQKMARTAFIPRKGNRYVEIDYGGAEVHGACWYHKDPQMSKYLHDPTSNMHRDMAKQIYMLEQAKQSYWDEKRAGGETRSSAKSNFVFPQFYGDYWKACAGHLYHAEGLIDPQGRPIKEHLKDKGIGTLPKFEKHIKAVEDDFWNNRFGVYGKWKEDWYNSYVKKGYMDTLTGFRISGFLRKNQIINTPIQGTAFQCLLWSFKELTKTALENNWKSRPVMQIHDSIIWDVYPPELQMVMETCQFVMVEQLTKHWTFISTPMEIDFDVTPIDGNWGQKKATKLSDITN